MQAKEFQEKNQLRWQKYEQKLNLVEKGSGNVHEVTDVPKMFSEVCTDLALSRHRMYGLPMNEKLNALVIRGHKQVHRRAKGTWDKLFRLIIVDFPAAVREEWRLLVVSTLVFVLPLIGVAMAGFHWSDFSWIEAILGEDMMASLDQMYGGSREDLIEFRDGYASDFMMFCFYIWNNIGIDFRMYAGGILACLGTLFFLFYNGIYFGAVVAYIHIACNTETFYCFVAGHSSFELIAMVIAGMAGLRIGLGILKRGRKTIRRSLMDAGKKSLPLILGAAIMTFVAAGIEGFWSAKNLEPTIKYTVGIALWVFCFLYLGLSGLGKRSAVEGSDA